MNQSNVIFGFLFAAFLVFITMRGELPKYLGFLLASPVNQRSADNITGSAPEAVKTSDAGNEARENFKAVASVVSKAMLFV